jgi:hypothetical protein
MRKNHFNASLKLLLVSESSLETINVEGIFNKFLVNVHKELVPFKHAEPLYPALMRLSWTSSSAIHIL